MNEALKEQLVSLVNSALEAGKNVVDFTVEQAPIVVEEIIKYHTAYYSTLAIVGGIVIALGVFIGIKSFKKAGELEAKSKDEMDRGHYLNAISYDSTGWIMGGVFLGLLPTIAGISIFLCNFLALLKVSFAPRLFLIEYISTLMK